MKCENCGFHTPDSRKPDFRVLTPTIVSSPPSGNISICPVCRKRRMTAKQNILVITASIAGILGYAYVLKLLNGNLPIVDSMSTVLSVVAQILMIKRFTEQWLIWILVDVVSVIMWFAAFFNGGESVAVFLMWVVYLINAVIMFVKWYKDSKNTVQITVKERQ